MIIHQVVMRPAKIHGYEENLCRQLVQIKWLLCAVLVFILATILSLFISAMIFKNQVTQLNAAETNQFLSDVFTMAANGRSASRDAPVLMKSVSSIAQMTSEGMRASNSTSFTDMMDTVSSVATEENLQMVTSAISNIPWEDTIIPMASNLLKNTENMENIFLLIISALQHENQPHYVVSEISDDS